MGILDVTNSTDAWNSLQAAKTAAAQAGQEASNKYASPEKTASMMNQAFTKAGPITSLRNQEASQQAELNNTYTNYNDPSMYPEITNPLIRGRLAAQRQNDIRQNLAVTRNTQQQVQGNTADIINAASANIKAENDRLAMEADLKKDGFSAALQMYGLVSQAEAEAQAEKWKQKEYELSIKSLEEQKRQFDEQMRLDYQKLSKSGSGGSGGGVSADLLYKMQQDAKEEANSFYMENDPSGGLQFKKINGTNKDNAISVTAADYARAKGTTVAELLSQSTNPSDNEILRLMGTNISNEELIKRYPYVFGTRL